MTDFVDRWLFDPTVGKFVAVVIGLLIVISVIKFVNRSLSKFVRDTEIRYRTRKFITFLGYVAAVFVYSSKLGGLTVAFGVAGAGIAFALQEVIASTAGWFAVSFAGFFKTGDRVLLGGIKGGVIDIGILRTTLMEVGEWVKGDLYSGRVVRIANSFVFKEPVFNYSGDSPLLWDEIVLPIKYGSDRQLAREILDCALGHSPPVNCRASCAIYERIEIGSARPGKRVTHHRFSGGFAECNGTGRGLQS